MKNISWLICFCMILIGLAACSSSEDKAQARFNEIEQQQSINRQIDPEANYRQLISDYPQTKGALKAQEQLELLLEKKQKIEMQQAYEAIKSIPRVVSGYKSIYRQWPRSIKDLDDGDYFFGSSYMAESISQGFSAYLALTANDSGFIVWALPDNSTASYRLSANGKKVIRGEKQALLTKIESDYRIEAQQGGLIFLLPKTVVK